MFKYTDIGIDLGEHEIKIAKVIEVKDEFNATLNQLSEYESYPVNSPIYSEEYFRDLKYAIKDFSKKIKSMNLSLNFAIPVNQYGTLNCVTIPKVEEKDLSEGIKFEAAQKLPDKKMSDYQINWKKIGYQDEYEDHEIMMGTLENEIIKKFSHFKTIKWKVNRIIFTPILLERFAKGSDIIVDFGHKKTKLYMYKEGELRKVETLSIGGDDLELEVKDYVEKNNLDVDYDELFKEIYFHNEFMEDEGLVYEVSKSLKGTMSTLLEEMKMAIRSFELENAISIETVSYMGGLSNLKYLNTAMESELDLDVLPIDIVIKEFEDVKYDLASLASITPNLKDSMDFSVYIKANIDYSSLLVASLTLSIALSGTFFFINQKYDKMIDEQTTLVQEQTSTISSIKKEIDQIEFERAQNQQFMNKIKGLKEKKTWLSDSLYMIPELTPLTVSISNFNLSQNEIELTGYSSDYSSVGFFAKKLEKLGQVSIDNIKDVKKADPKIYSVITSDPESISNMYLMKKEFKITVNHAGNLMNH